MKILSGKEFERILRVRGWQLARTSGSHHIYTKAGSIFRISVPVHGNKSLKIGLQKYLMKLARIKESDL